MFAHCICMTNINSTWWVCPSFLRIFSELWVRARERPFSLLYSVWKNESKKKGNDWWQRGSNKKEADGKKRKKVLLVLLLTNWYCQFRRVLSCSVIIMKYSSQVALTTSFCASDNLFLAHLLSRSKLTTISSSLSFTSFLLDVNFITDRQDKHGRSRGCISKCCQNGLGLTAWDR